VPWQWLLRLQLRRLICCFIKRNFSDLLIGFIGMFEILVDPYTDFAKGTTGVRGLQSIDIAGRHAELFAAMLWQACFFLLYV
jgi:hypothetical protein